MAESRFEKFSELAQRVMQAAQEEARRFNHNYIGTEHIMLGLVRETEGVAARVLSNLGVDLTKVRSAVEFIIGRGGKPFQEEIDLTPRAKKVLELAIDECRRMNHTYVDTEHLLVGLLREGEGVAAGVLESLGVTLDKLRLETRKILLKVHISQPSVVEGDPFDVSFQRVGVLRQRMHRLDEAIRLSAQSNSIDDLKAQRDELVREIRTALTAMSEMEF